MLQLKWTYLWEVERVPGRNVPPGKIPTLRDAAADVSHESPVHLDRALLDMPLERGLPVATRFAVDHLGSHKHGNQVKRQRAHGSALSPLDLNQSGSLKTRVTWRIDEVKELYRILHEMLLHVLQEVRMNTSHLKNEEDCN